MKPILFMVECILMLKEGVESVKCLVRFFV